MVTLARSLLSRRALLLSASVAALASSLSAGPASIENGRALFQQNCAMCHEAGAQGASGQGPSLAGVLHRRAASLPEFAYSPALQQSGITWDASALDRFLSNPGGLVPGTAMSVIIPAPPDRADLIAFLATLPRRTAQVAALPVGRDLSSDDPGDWRKDAPGVPHLVRLDQLPPPFESGSSSNGPRLVARPPATHLAVPPGFTVEAFATKLSGPRLIRVAPNGDLFVSETGAGRVRVLRAPDGAAAPAENVVFADGLHGPFGLAFFPLGPEPQWVYVATVNSVVRYPYRNGDLQARGPAEVVVSRLAPTMGGHTTRDLAFSLDGRRLFISVGSSSNVAEGLPAKSPPEIRQWEHTHGLGSAWGAEENRADILQIDPAGHGPLQTYATGIRNGVSLGVHPGTGDLWTCTNERDRLGDNLVPDYLTRVREGGFYGWPWYYLGNHEDPRHAGKRPDLAGKAALPDLLVQAHSAVLGFDFYPPAASGPAAFPPEYRGNLFAAFHGSWNRSIRTGAKVVRVRLKDGVPIGGYEDFLTGFTVDNTSVWGRPVSVAVAHDGALFVSDDAGSTIWRVAYRGLK